MQGIPIKKGLVTCLSTLAEFLTPHPENDCIEFSISSTAKACVSVYPRTRLTTKQLIALFPVLSLSKKSECVLWSLLSRIPAERHMFRVALDGRVSIFFKTDIPVVAIESLTAALGLTNGSKPIVDYFSGINRMPCGLAIEASPQDNFRLRLYDIVAGTEALVQNLQSCDLAVISEKNREQVIYLGQELLGPKQLAVINLGVDTYSGFSVKFEFPDIPLRRPSTALELNLTEYDAFEHACKLAMDLGLQSFSYLGVRYACQQDREITFYFDARRALASG